MKIKLLIVTNLKKVKHVEITPEDNVIVIAGKNESGKTSVLDAILWAMTGKMGMKGINKPIREGEEEAEVVLEIDNFVVRRCWKDNERSYLTVANKDNNIQYKSPQSMLDGFLGKLSLDPLEFTLLNSKEQRDLLLEVLDLKNELDKIEETKKYIYDKRTVIGREIKTYEGQLKGLKYPKKDLPKKTISISELSKKIEKAKDYNDKLYEDKKNIEENLRKIKLYNEQIKGLKKEIELLTKDIKDKKFKDLKIIRKKIEKAEIINEKIREAEKYREVSDIVVKRKSEVGELTDEIRNLDKNKLKLLKSKEMPIKDLTIDEEAVSYKNIPFNQLASSEQLKVSMAMAMNPKLRVIRITDGSLLDDDNMRVIEEMAKKFDYQIWLERVAIDKFADIVLVDGEIKNRNYKVRS